MKIGCLEVPKPSYPPYFDQLSERYQPLVWINTCIYHIYIGTFFRRYVLNAFPQKPDADVL